MLGTLHRKDEDAAGGCVTGGTAQAKAPGAQQRQPVDRHVGGAAGDRVEPADGAAVAAEEVIAGLRLRRARAVGALGRVSAVAARVPVPPRRSPRKGFAEPARAVGGHRQPGGARSPDHVPQAARERSQLDAERRRDPAPRVKAPRRPPACVRGGAQRPQPRVGAGAAVLNTRAREVKGLGTRTSLAQAFLPLLLVSAVLERDVERAGERQGAAPDRHVDAPRELCGRVLFAQLERRQRRAPRARSCAAPGPPAARPRVP